MPDQSPLLGIPYPLPEDAVTDYPGVGRDLAETLDGLVPLLARSSDVPAEAVPKDGTMAEVASQRPRLTLPVAGNYLAFAFAHVGMGNEAAVAGPAAARPMIAVAVVAGTGVVGTPSDARAQMTVVQYEVGRLTMTHVCTIAGASAGDVLGILHGTDGDHGAVWTHFVDVGRLLGAIPLGATPVPASLAEREGSIFDPARVPEVTPADA
jgi:hypothetical protein